MRILRGSGTAGIAGIPPVRDNKIVRPLIEVSRKEIEQYCTTCNIPYAIDSSNREKRFLRNRIRMELLPMMLEYQPRLIEHLGNLSDILRQEDQYLDQKAKDFADRNLEEETKGEISISLSSFKGLPSPLKNRTVRYLLKRAGNGLRKITRHHINAVSVLAESSKPQGFLNLPNGIVVKKVYERLIFFMGKQKESIEFEYILERPGAIYLESLARTIYITEVNRSMVPEVMDLPNVAYLDGDRVRYPFKVRNFRSGDRFTPLGMKGSRKVKDFFIDLKIPSQTRRTVPILINQEEIVWICGYRIDDKYKITPKTERVFKVTLSGFSPNYSTE
jgi:tRNA(Ile)-lysidine synthase